MRNMDHSTTPRRRLGARLHGGLVVRRVRQRVVDGLRRWLVVLALAQVVAPAMAAVADAWRLDRRTPVAHIESPGTEGCVVVHADDCGLCAMATVPMARPGDRVRAPEAQRAECLPAAPNAFASPLFRLRLAPSRAPPLHS